MRTASFTLFLYTVLAALFVTGTLANACSGGVQACCGSASVGCSGNICKVCCGNTCGCWYWRSSTCSSSSTPCVDMNNPDFATTNGQCIAPSSGSSGNSASSSSSSSSSSGSTSSTTSSKPAICAQLRGAFLRAIFGC